MDSFADLDAPSFLNSSSSLFENFSNFDQFLANPSAHLKIEDFGYDLETALNNNNQLVNVPLDSTLEAVLPSREEKMLNTHVIQVTPFANLSSTTPYQQLPIQPPQQQQIIQPLSSSSSSSSVAVNGSAFPHPFTTLFQTPLVQNQTQALSSTYIAPSALMPNPTVFEQQQQQPQLPSQLQPEIPMQTVSPKDDLSPTLFPLSSFDTTNSMDDTESPQNSPTKSKRKVSQKETTKKRKARAAKRMLPLFGFFFSVLFLIHLLPCFSFSSSPRATYRTFLAY
jgi:hypothetical protein